MICSYSGKQCLSRRDAGTIVNKFKRHHRYNEKYPRRVYYCASCGAFHVTGQKHFVA